MILCSELLCGNPDLDHLQALEQGPVLSWQYLCSTAVSSELKLRRFKRHRKFIKLTGSRKLREIQGC